MFFHSRRCDAEEDGQRVSGAVWSFHQESGFREFIAEIPRNPRKEKRMRTAVNSFFLIEWPKQTRDSQNKWNDQNKHGILRIMESGFSKKGLKFRVLRRNQIVMKLQSRMVKVKKAYWLGVFMSAKKIRKWREKALTEKLHFMSIHFQGQFRPSKKNQAKRTRKSETKETQEILTKRENPKKPKKSAKRRKRRRHEPSISCRS